MELDEVDVVTPEGEPAAAARSSSETLTEDASDAERPAGFTHRGIGAMVLQRLFDREPAAMSIGRFQVLERIGRGGMGTVYSAYDERLDRKVAVKVLGRNDRTSELARQRLEREAQAMARLSHPNVITVHEVGESDEGLFIAMEFIRGQSLEAWFQAEPDWREVIDAFVQAGQGLIAAHAAGLIHRDLKPQNIMRSEDGVVKVLDFGLARAIGEEGSAADQEPAEVVSASGSGSLSASASGSGSKLSTDLTRTGALLGTPAYMAPEQHQGLPADARSDQFSFCVALYEGLYGQSPFAGENLVQLAHAVLTGAVRPPPADHRVPAFIERVVQRGLSLDPDHRWPSMHELVQQLRRDPSRTRRRWIAAAGVVGLVALSGAGLMGLWDRGQPACPSPTAATDALWSEERRQQVATAFESTGSPLAAATLERLAPTIAGYTEQLGAMRAQACHAHRSGEHSARLFDLRAACLDVRQAGVDQLLTEFERADASTVENAAWAAASLRPVDPCGDTEALTAALAPPEDPQVARRVQAQRERLASASAQVYAGAYDEAREQLDAALEQAVALDYAPLLAEVQLHRGTALMEAHEHEPARAALSEALAVALRSGHDEVAVEANARRMWVLADPLRRPQEALGDDEFAQALLEKLGQPTPLRWLLLNNRGVAQFRGGLRAEAERSYRDALGALGDVQAFPLEHISTRFNLAVLLSIGLGEPEAAAAELLSAKDQAIALLGPDHPRVGVITARLVASLVAATRYEQAQAQLDASLSRWSEREPFLRALLLLEQANLHLLLRRYEPAQRAVGEVLALVEVEAIGSVATSMLAVARIGRGEVDEGIAQLRRAIELERERSGPEHENVANAHWWAGYGLHLAGRREEAAAELAQVEAIFSGLGLDGPPYLGRVFAEQVSVAIERGDLREAERRLDDAVAAQDAAGFSEGNAYRAQADRLRADLLVARGDPAGARVLYATACRELEAGTSALNPDVAACDLDHARALGPSDTARALAKRSRATYESLGEGFAPERAEADALLASWASATGPTDAVPP